MTAPNKSRQKRSILWSVPKHELELIILNSSSYSVESFNLYLWINQNIEHAPILKPISAHEFICSTLTQAC
jgi:hypothetical protein